MCHNSGIDEDAFLQVCRQLRHTWEEVVPEHHDTYGSFKKHLVNAAKYELSKERNTKSREQQRRAQSDRLCEWSAQQLYDTLNNTQGA
jgi:hypothetical protein